VAIVYIPEIEAKMLNQEFSFNFVKVCVLNEEVKYDQILIHGQVVKFNN